MQNNFWYPIKYCDSIIRPTYCSPFIYCFSNFAIAKVVALDPFASLYNIYAFESTFFNSIEFLDQLIKAKIVYQKALILAFNLFFT